MKLNIFEKIIGSGLFTGYIPFASGTFGSLAALLIYMIPGFENPTILLFVISVSIIIGVPISTKFEKKYGTDPAECTIDELIGMWISLIFVPKNIWFILTAFVIWRILDILKPFPAKQAESINGGIGIILDDVISGIYTLILIHIFTPNVRNRVKRTKYKHYF